METNLQPEYERWQIAGKTPLVVYSIPIMLWMTEEAARAGEADAAGVLFGGLEAGGIRIDDARAVAPDSFGSEKMDLALKDLSRACIRDPELRELTPVGFYRSCRQTSPHLSENDVHVFERHFPQRFQVALILQVNEDQRTRAWFFFGQPPGIMPTKAAPAFDQLSFSMPAAADSPSAQRHSVRKRRLSKSQLWKWGGAIAFAAILACAGGVYYGQRQNPATVGTDYGVATNSTVETKRLVDLHLRVRREPDGQMRVVWDASLAAVQNATSGAIQVVEGAVAYAVAVPPVVLRNGSCPIVSGSEDLKVTLQLRTPDGLVSETIHLKGGIEKVAAPATPPVNINPQPATRPARVRPQVQPARAKVQPTPASSRKRSQPVAVSIGETPDRFLQPTRAQEPSGSRLAHDAPRSTPLQSANSDPGEIKRPTSGVVLWTGYLSVNSSLIFQEGRPSKGSLRGTLPRFTNRLIAYRAELTHEGISVYSADAEHSSGDRILPTNAQTGWLITRRIYDPQRAGRISVAITPARGEESARFLISNGGLPVTALLIQWSAQR